MPFAPVGRGKWVVDEEVEEVDDAADDAADPEVEDAESEADEVDEEPEVDAADSDVERAVDATAVLWTADPTTVFSALATTDEDGKERIKTVLVIVPYTVLFLNTVSGLKVTVALLVSVNIKTSVVCTLTSCLQPTSTANLPEVGRTTLGLGILKDALAA